MVAGVGFLVAMAAHRRSGRDPGAAGTALRRRTTPDTGDAWQDGSGGPDRGGEPDPYAVDPRPVDRYPTGSREPGAVDERALRDLAIVRYDALQEMGGQLSFSLALLNANGDGIVLTSINGRAETRTYAKTVVTGQGSQELSPEEVEAIRLARMGKGPAEQARAGTKPKITRETGAPGPVMFSQFG
jgi:hypothetical protein